jgi:hypothetical protein
MPKQKKTKKVKERMYEVNGVIKYAHCFSIEVKAKSPLDAQNKVRSKLGSMSDPASAEFQGGIVDEGILVT